MKVAISSLLSVSSPISIDSIGMGSAISVHNGLDILLTKTIHTIVGLLIMNHIESSRIGPR